MQSLIEAAEKYRLIHSASEASGNKEGLNDAYVELITALDEAKKTSEANVEQDLNNRFTYHPPMPNQIGKFENIRKNARWMVTLFTQMCPKSRELSLAITKIEEAVFWANAAIARNEKE